MASMFNGEHENVRTLEGAADFEAALAAPQALIYKHSPACGLSTIAADEVRKYLREHPGMPVFVVDVIGRRSLSAEIARRLEVRHESPQAIILREGKVDWHASHRGVTEEALARVAA